MVTVTCDSPGCKSFCTLHPTDKNRAEAAIKERGWSILEGADGKKYYYLFDGLGSHVGMTDSSGNEVNRYDYDPYGQVINQQEQSGLNNPWKFAGGYLDSSTGL